MRVNKRAATFVKVALTLIAAFAVTQCGSSTPTAPTGSVVASVALSTTTVAAGGTLQATVTLSAVTSTAVVVTMGTSNRTVATVPGSVTVAAGASTATVTVTAVAAGAATITASVSGGSTTQSTVLTVSASATLASLTLSASSVVGGESVTGTVVLNAAAPAGGAAVSLTGTDPVTVAASVTVPAGSTSATFSVFTRGVGGTIPATVGAAYNGTSLTAALSVTPPTVATARFGVTGPTESDTCTMSNGGATMNCTFNGSTSTAPGTITAYDWTFTVAGTFTQTTAGAVLTDPTVNCSLLPSPPMPAGTSSFPLTVKLKIHDSLGNVSAETVNSGARVIPQGVCGF